MKAAEWWARNGENLMSFVRQRVRASRVPLQDREEAEADIIALLWLAAKRCESRGIELNGAGEQLARWTISRYWRGARLQAEFRQNKETRFQRAMAPKILPLDERLPSVREALVADVDQPFDAARVAIDYPGIIAGSEFKQVERALFYWMARRPEDTDREIGRRLGLAHSSVGYHRRGLAAKLAARGYRPE